MPAVITWDDSADWTNWINADVTRPTDTRIVGDYMKLPFNEWTAIGSSITQRAKWRFGTNQDYTDSIDTHHGASINGAQIVENGLLLPTKNAYATVNESAALNQPKFIPMYISCWFKSDITDYSDGIGIIVGYTKGVGDGDIQYAIGVNTSNQIKGWYSSGGSTVEVPVTHGDVRIDTNWHFAVLNINTGVPSSGVLYIDNNPINLIITAPLVRDVGIGTQFSVGSCELSDANGFTGTIDDVYITNASSITASNLISYRFIKNVFLSPVVDTERNDSILSGLLSEFEIPSGSMLTFSFRSSNDLFTQNSTDLTWTNFTAPNQIVSGVEADISDLGVFVKGRYQQVRVKMTPSDVDSTPSDPLQIGTPILMSLTINTSVAISLLPVSVPAYHPGEVLQQIDSFSSNNEEIITKTIHKVALNLSVTAKERRTFVIGRAGVVSFQAANFQSSRDDWIWQPVISPSWESSGTPIANTYQSIAYTSSADAIVNASFLHYDLFFPESGSYDLWGYGYTGENGIFWGFDHDTSHLRRLELGLDDSGWIGIPRWTKFGSIYLEEGGVYGFTVYLGDLDSVVLDQWYFTTITKLSDILDEFESVGYELPLPLSKSPFNTAVRLRSLDNGEAYDVDNPPSGAIAITGWGPSADKSASGKFNYAIRDNDDNNGVDFTDGVAIEYWQIGGDRDYFASWDYKFT